MPSTTINPLRRTVHKRTARRVVAAVAAVGVLSGTGLAAVPAARADILSDAFIETIEERGITYPDRARAIGAGRAVCAILGTGGSLFDAVAALYRNNNLTWSDASYVTGAAVTAFCPEYAAAARTVGWV